MNRLSLDGEDVDELRHIRLVERPAFDDGTISQVPIFCHGEAEVIEFTLGDGDLPLAIGQLQDVEAPDLVVVHSDLPFWPN